MIINHDFKVGDQVRLHVEKQIYDKGDVIQWSDKVYTIQKIDKNKIYVEDIDRFYKPYELMKITDDVGVFDKVEKEHEKVHVAVKKAKKINKELKELGIEQKNDLGDSKRIKKPSYKMLNQ